MRAHPDFVSEIERLIGMRQAGDPRQPCLHAVGDAALAQGDAYIAWDGGGLTLNAAERDAVIRAEPASLPSRGRNDEDRPRQPLDQ